MKPAQDEQLQATTGPYIGTESRPSHSHTPHPLFQRQDRIASVDSGKGTVGSTLFELVVAL